MLRPLTGPMQYKITPQNDAQQHATYDRNRIESIEEQKVRQFYRKKLSKDITKIDPTQNLEEYDKKIRTVIKKAAKETTATSRSAKKPCISEETLKLPDQKTTLKQTKNTSTQREQRYKDLWKKVKKSDR